VGQAEPGSSVPPVACRPILSAANGHFFAGSKCLNVAQSVREDVFRRDVNADVIFLGHEEEEAAHVMPEADLRLPGLRSRFAVIFGRDPLLAAGSADRCRGLRVVEP
jgi:hypothetical protein